MTEEDIIIPNKLASNVYNWLPTQRSNKTGGGIALFYISDLKINERNVNKFPAMECTD